MHTPGPMKTYSRSDGYTYKFLDGDLVAYPTLTSGGYEEENMLYVADFAEPLTKKELKEVMDKLK